MGVTREKNFKQHLLKSLARLFRLTGLASHGASYSRKLDISIIPHSLREHFAEVCIDASKEMSWDYYETALDIAHLLKGPNGAEYLEVALQNRDSWALRQQGHLDEALTLIESIQPMEGTDDIRLYCQHGLLQLSAAATFMLENNYGAAINCLLQWQPPSNLKETQYERYVTILRDIALAKTWIYTKQFEHARACLKHCMDRVDTASRARTLKPIILHHYIDVMCELDLPHEAHKVMQVQMDMKHFAVVPDSPAERHLNLSRLELAIMEEDYNTSQIILEQIHASSWAHQAQVTIADKLDFIRYILAWCRAEWLPGNNEGPHSGILSTLDYAYKLAEEYHEFSEVSFYMHLVWVFRATALNKLGRRSDCWEALKQAKRYASTPLYYMPGMGTSEVEGQTHAMGYSVEIYKMLPCTE
jgi:tetratricopeptide (TPR) repeat protein